MKKIFGALLTLIIFSIALSPAKADNLSFKTLLDKAIKNSYDLKTSQIDIKIAETQIKDARSEYLPTLSLGYDVEYDKDLTGGTAALTSIGTTTIVNSTQYQNALSAGLQYNIFDFGVRRKKLDIAKKDKNEKRIVYTQSLRDLKVGLADAYTKALLASRELQTNDELLTLNKTLFTMSESLYNAGTTRKTDMADQALKVAVLINKIDTLKSQLKHSLSDISYFTGESYSTSAKILNLFDDGSVVPVNNIKIEIY